MAIRGLNVVKHNCLIHYLAQAETTSMERYIKVQYSFEERLEVIIICCKDFIYILTICNNKTEK